MAKQKAKQNQPEVRKTQVRNRARTKKVIWNYPLEKNNLIFIGIGIGIIILGYLLMATGITEEPAVVDGKWNNPWAVSVAPILLVIGYCVVIPIAIMKLFKKSQDDSKISE